MTQPTVRGVRICQDCRGICHEGSWRSRYGTRKKYWCCEPHLRNRHEHWPADEWPAFRDEWFERVDVVTN